MRRTHEEDTSGGRTRRTHEEDTRGGGHTRRTHGRGHTEENIRKRALEWKIAVL